MAFTGSLFHTCEILISNSARPPTLRYALILWDLDTHDIFLFIDRSIKNKKKGERQRMVLRFGYACSLGSQIAFFFKKKKENRVVNYFS